MDSKLFTIFLAILSGSLRTFKLILSLIAGIILFSTMMFVLIYFYFARDLPDIKSIEDYNPPVISQVLADDGSVIGEFWTECRIFLPYEKIPKRVSMAFIASEDSRFFEHKGVDMRSIARAFIANLKAGEITQGGSTITQQVTRSLLLSSERTLTRKVKEAILATRIERTLNKEQILTLYLNQIFLGNRAYGIAAAARNYFHKTVDELSVAETALIAGMPSAPSFFSPLTHASEARQKQIHVLERMVDDGVISKNEMKAALEERLTIYTAGIDKDFASPEAAYFIEHIRRLVKEKYGDDMLYRRGLKIYSTVNIETQKAAYSALRHGIEKLDKRQGWRGVIEHIDEKDISERAELIMQAILQKQNGGKTIWPQKESRKENFEIIFEPSTPYQAIVTGFDGTDTLITIGTFKASIPKDGIKWARPFSTDRTNYDDGNFISDPKKILKVGDIILVRRAENGSFQLFQEPLVEGALFAFDPHSAEVKAMMGGYDFARSEFNRATQAIRQPGSSFKPFVYAAALDRGYTYNTTIMDAPVAYVVGKNEIWSPKNYGGGYKGPTPFRNAIVFSRNVPTVKIVADIGTHYLTAFVRKLGITTPIGKYLSMALGANGVYLSEVIPAYTTFLNEGVYNPPIYIRKIEDSKGNALEENKPPEQVEEENFEFSAKKLKASDIELNTELFDHAKEWIQKDKLVLNDLDLKTLYGDKIPKGHVITPQTAYLMVNLLKGVVEGGTGTRVKALGKPAAGKTGTTNDETDTWFNGFVPDLAAGVWVGFDSIMPLGHGETGGKTAAPIFLEFMQNATKDMEVKDFTPPNGFPMGRIAELSGGSSLFGSRIGADVLADRHGADRAGEFFEEDLESYSQDGGQPPPISSQGSSDELGF